MPALNFKTQFAPLVESGAKRRTIRAFRKDKRDPKGGDPLYLYTGLRTKAARLLLKTQCTSARHVNIFSDSARYVKHSAERNTFDDILNLDKFAQLDGFANWGEMRDWFDKTHGLPFNGLLIEW